MFLAEQVILDLPWKDREFYGNFLAQTYYFVCHSTRLLARSMSHFQTDREGLYRRFLSHMSEEDNHEKIALSDLKKLGFSLADFPESSYTRAFWQSQYYLADTSKGTALLGYILFLEAVAVESYPKLIEHLYKFHGKKCCQFLKVHVEEDPDHVLHAIEEIQNLPEADKKEVWKNFEQTAKIYCEILKDASENKELSVPHSFMETNLAVENNQHNTIN